MKRAKKISLIVFCCLLGLILIATSVGLGLYFSITKSQSFEKEKLVDPNLHIEVFDSENNLISDKNMFNNQYINLSSLNQNTIDAFVSIEDKSFFTHNGINLKRMASAMLKNIGKGRFVEGASTISQQLIKNTHLSSEKTLERKIKEISRFTENDVEKTRLIISENGKDTEIILEKAERIPESAKNQPKAAKYKQGLYLKLKNTACAEFDAVKSVLSKNRGDAPVIIYCSETGRKLEAPASLRVSPSEALFEQLGGIIGKENVKFIK